MANERGHQTEFINKKKCVEEGFTKRFYRLTDKIRNYYGMTGERTDRQTDRRIKSKINREFSFAILITYK
jgi:hypothetical protein